jgi:adenylate kinase
MTASLIHSEVSDQHRSSTNVPYADTMLQVARQGYSFQTREVLQRVVMGEQARIREEQML